MPDFPRPHEDDRLVSGAAVTRRVERLGSRSSDTYQLEAFATAVRQGAPVTTDADFSVANMDRGGQDADTESWRG